MSLYVLWEDHRGEFISLINRFTYDTTFSTTDSSVLDDRQPRFNTFSTTTDSSNSTCPSSPRTFFEQISLKPAQISPSSPAQTSRSRQYGLCWR